MTGIPHYFEYLKEKGDRSRVYPFAYDQSVQGFVIAKRTVALEDFDPHTFNFHELGLDGEEVDFDDLSEQALVIPSFGALIAGPRLHEWAKRHPREVAAARQVMREAFRSLTADDELLADMLDEEGSSDDPVGHLGFAASLRGEAAGVHLQVLGNCACMGPDPHGNYIEGQFEEGFAEYGLHNADSQAQRASLYAGLGHLAWLTDARQPGQGRLFS